MSSRAARALALGLATLTAVATVSCAKVPYTGRRQFNLVPDGIMRGLGKQTYASMLQGKPVQRQGSSAAILDRVGGRISGVASRPDYDWQYRLIDEPVINAWCLPGGYIGFYTGILPVLENEAGMAFVMGHEVGHAVAKHGAERVSQNLALFGGLAGLELILAGNTKMTDEQRAMLLGALGVGAQVGVTLPFSRTHEKEADVIGLLYMASAGYPPEESIAVWDRMAAAGGAKPPAFLSTHPTEARRQTNLREWMPQARKRYDRNRVSGDPLATIWDGPVPSASQRTPSTQTPSSETPDPPSGPSGGNR